MRTATIVLSAMLASGCMRSVRNGAWVEESSSERYAVTELPVRTEPLVTAHPNVEPPRVTSNVTVMLRSGRETKHHQARAQRTPTEVIVDRGPEWPPLRTYTLDEVMHVRVDDVERKRVARTRRVIEPTTTALLVAGVVTGMILLAVAIEPAVSD